ncbi:MAG: PQQ-like beta-propeller repeat protein [Verrucomicrobiaceae bacterium]|nr:PQQ-like beta-propeller repeat protein [Verrucomicrobiaceae bacterium]
MNRPLTSLLCLFATTLTAADWNQWRGPGRNGVSHDTTPIAETFPADGLRKVWASDFIPSNEYGGHASPVISGERVFLSVVWHERVPSETREIDTEVMQTLNFRGTSPELEKKLEETRLNLPRLRGEKFDEWIVQWRKDNLTEKEDINIGSWVASRFKAGKNAIGLQWLKKMSDRQGKPFESATAFNQWLDAEGFPPDVKEKMIAAVPNTVKIAQDVILCLDLNTGKQVWKFSKPGKPSGRQSSSTCAVVDGRVYAACSTELLCVDETDGKLLWTAPLPIKGPAASPLVVGDRVFMAAGHACAFSTKDGKLLWEQKQAKGSIASPTWWQPEKSKAVVVINGNNALHGVNPENGDLLWTVEGGSQSTPVAEGDWLVIYSGTEGVGLRAYQMQADGPPKAAWSRFWVTRRYTGSPIIHEGSVYLTCGEKHQCVDLATGAEKWVVNEINSTITSPLLVDGKLLVYENNGTHVRMIKASPSAYEQLGRAKTDAMGCSSPAIARGRFLVRQKDKLVCFDLRPQQ